VGAGRQRAGRRRERARPAARRPGFRADRARAPLDHRAVPRRPRRPARLRTPPGRGHGPGHGARRGQRRPREEEHRRRR
jgi:hypothetical protein